MARRLTPDDLFGAGVMGNLLKGEYQTDRVYAWFQKRHDKGKRIVTDEGYWERAGHTWKVPYGVRQALHARLTFAQNSTKYPFYATWTSPKTGKRLIKYFMSLPSAIDFVACKAQYVDPQASIVARHGFYIPRKLMGKFPRKMNGKLHYWCPRCMDARTFVRNGEEFHTRKKYLVWDDKARDYVYRMKEVKLAVLECSVCGITNRDNKFRASNQPLEIRKIKKGVRKIKRRK